MLVASIKLGTLTRLPTFKSEEGGMLGVEVKFVDIKRNTGGEGGLLDSD